MNRLPVQSSNVKSVGYEGHNKTLEIEFKNGSVYQHPNVDELEYTKLIMAPSVGKHYSANIKGNYASRKIQ